MSRASMLCALIALPFYGCDVPVEDDTPKLQHPGGALATSGDRADRRLFPTLEEKQWRANEGPDEDSAASIASLPMDAIRALMGSNVGVEMSVSQNDSTAAPVLRSRVFRVNHELAPIVPEVLEAMRHAVPDKFDPPVVSVPLRFVESEDHSLVYVRFLPEIAPDAASRVDWGNVENRISPRAALIQAESLRQLELEALAEERGRQLMADSGCIFLERSRAANAGYALCSSPNELDDLVFVESWAHVKEVLPALNGTHHRADTGLQSGHIYGQNFDGSTPRPNSGRPAVEVAVLDQEGFNQAQLHPAYLKSISGPSRITRRRTCSNTTCSTTATTITGFEGAHGEIILGAFASIFGGQDPSVTKAGRAARSYGPAATEIELYYTNATTASYAQAIVDAATTDGGVDLIYVGAFISGCAQPNTFPDIRDAWNLAYSMGTLGVVPAGWTVGRYSDGCTVNGFATRTDVVVVGAYGDDVTNSNQSQYWLPNRHPTPINAWVLDTQPLMGWHWTDIAQTDNCVNSPPSSTCWSSAIGGGPLKVYNGATTQIWNSWSGVDLVGPSGREYSARYFGGVPGYGIACCGTSLAGAEVTAITSSILDWAYSDGLTIFHNPSITHVNLLLMGDHKIGPYNEIKDRQWGAGRFKARIATSEGMDAPFGWQTSTFPVQTGTYYILLSGDHLPSGVDIVRAAVSWDEPNFDASGVGAAADIHLWLGWTTRPMLGDSPPYIAGYCPEFPHTAPTALAFNTSRDLDKYVERRDYSFGNKCVYLQVNSNVPPGEVRTIYYAAYWEDLARDDADGPGVNID